MKEHRDGFNLLVPRYYGAVTACHSCCVGWRDDDTNDRIVQVRRWTGCRQLLLHHWREEGGNEPEEEEADVLRNGSSSAGTTPAGSRSCGGGTAIGGGAMDLNRRPRQTTRGNFLRLSLRASFCRSFAERCGCHDWGGGEEDKLERCGCRDWGGREEDKLESS